MPKYTLLSLFRTKMFLGGQKRRWNPQMISYIAGARNHIYIIDIIHSAMRLKKWLLFVSLACQKRSVVMFVLRPALESLLQIVYPFALCAIKWKGGLLSNYRCVSKQYNLGTQATSYINEARYMGPLAKIITPHIVVSFAEYIDKGDVCLDEARKTRTPSCTVADTTLSPNAATFQVFSNPNFEVCSFLSRLTSAAIRKGKRLERCTLYKSLKLMVIKRVKKHFLSPESLNIYLNTPMLDNVSDNLVKFILNKNIEMFVQTSSKFSYITGQTDHTSLIVKLLWGVFMSNKNRKTPKFHDIIWLNQLFKFAKTLNKPIELAKNLG